MSLHVDASVDHVLVISLKFGLESEPHSQSDFDRLHQFLNDLKLKLYHNIIKFF